MKRLVLFLIVATLVFSAIAAIPTKMARLTVINKSGEDVMLKLTGSEVTESFYYLTIPAGTRDAPTTKVFTVLQDLYARETFACGGLTTEGQLFVTGNLRLTFTPCDQMFSASKKNIAGEPTMEKIVAFRYLAYGLPIWSNAYKYDGYWNKACVTLAWMSKNYNRPLKTQCLWRYQY